jgi:hypothetical protein
LYQAVGDEIVTLDEITFAGQAENTSYARIPNATGPFMVTETMTPGSENQETIVSIPEDANAADGIFVFPNPATSEVQFKASAVVYNVSIYSMQGIEVKSKIVQNSSGTLHVANLSAGVYIIRFNTEGGAKTLKIFKK